MISKFIYGLFRIYRYVLSPAIMAFSIRCRYEESCSHFTERQIREKGLLKGMFFGVKRILSCNAFNVKEEKYGS